MTSYTPINIYKADTELYREFSLGPVNARDCCSLKAAVAWEIDNTTHEKEKEKDYC